MSQAEARELGQWALAVGFQWTPVIRHGWDLRPVCRVQLARCAGWLVRVLPLAARPYYTLTTDAALARGLVLPFRGAGAWSLLAMQPRAAVDAMVRASGGG